MVTGRELTSLFNTFAGFPVFEKIVAENGAVVHDPQSQSIERLAEGPPPDFLQLLERAIAHFAELGLMPIAEYERLLGEFYSAEVRSE